MVGAFPELVSHLADPVGASNDGSQEMLKDVNTGTVKEFDL